MTRRFTPRVDNVLVAADELAAELGHDHIGTARLQVALAGDRHGLASQVLQRLEVVDEVVAYLLVTMGPTATTALPRNGSADLRRSGRCT